MRIAYFVTSYRSPQMLMRLLRTLRAGDPTSVIVVHHDRFRSTLDESALAAIGDVHLLTSDAPIVWGDMTLESARWRVFAWMLEHVEFDWAVLLSEQDYPIRQLSGLAARLGAGGADAVVELDRLDRIPDRSLRREHERRYLYRFVELPRPRFDAVPGRVRRMAREVRIFGYRAFNKIQSTVRVYWFPEALQLPTKIGVRSGSRLFGPDYPCWVNSPWFALSRTAMERLCATLRERPDLVAHYERTIIPLESASATILANDPELVIENASLHHIRWSRPTTGRPDVLGLDAVDGMLASGLYFARKFDPDDHAVLDLLDEQVLGTSPARPSSVVGA
ncbi:beta-1,6-N-acetylglucosaminyltransferase [Pseudonocardia sp.]|uniref:beta-1,6-N-acetylglucosaminyltransferase n=1 Tax=Pseudonocardia sp. TaxID=60912 RepID=UPI003D135A98